jgi:hypothetical protein
MHRIQISFSNVEKKLEKKNLKNLKKTTKNRTITDGILSDERCHISWEARKGRLRL